ncbi:hypothetical protein CAL26_09360 [Bordetella genomosp. 9]|uniref:Uncharacterized protein n=1 Tax=Bordetella genomosp. 9 TaxID=1416803 RepID=A0A261RFS9_9BORD|nr:hypothetical protein [Bordetella genomosp. 9]OZI23637.1 hypothetical protein CAL26_09360 [Bordetella genomosp. 9]
MPNISRRKLVQKELHYKKATFLNPTPLTLQDMLKAALAKLDVTQRHEEVNDVGLGSDNMPTVVQRFVRLLNSPRDFRGFQFGVLVLFTPGDHHLVIDAVKRDMKPGEHLAELDVAKHAPPDGKHFLDTLLHFAVRDNHVVVIQSMSLRARHLQDHLQWLLREARQIDDKQAVFLTDEISESIKAKLRQAPIKSMKLETQMVSAIELPDGTEDTSSKALQAVGRGWEAMKGLLGGTSYKPITGEELEEVPDIGVKIEVTVRGRAPAGTTNDKVMKSLMGALQGADGVRFRANLKGVGTLRNEDFYIHDRKSIGSFDGQLVQTEAYEEMAKWLESLIHSGQINVDV